MSTSKKIILVSLVTFVFVIPVLTQEKANDFPVLKGPYLGQPAPGMTPKIFASDILFPGKNKGCSAFMENGKMFIFAVSYKGESIFYETRIKNGRWTEPERSTLSSEYYDGDFTLSPDGVTILFSSRRPLNDESDASEKSNIWKVRRELAEWSNPMPLPSPINTENHESYPTVTKDGTLYFFTRNRGGFGKSDIFLSRTKNGKYHTPENVGRTINTPEQEWDPYIAPDGSYLIFCSTKGEGYGEDDIYVSHRKRDGSWNDPTNLGEAINSSASENRPYVTQDGKYFFYTRHEAGKRDIYWVDAKIIEELKPENLK